MLNQLISKHSLSKLTLASTLLALSVVVLGAYTRLSDSGLGCPDWPGCYGQLLAPSTSDTILQAANAFPGQVIEPHKAWTEMVHRYVAGTLGLLILLISIKLYQNRSKYPLPFIISSALVGLVIFQALLGMWTVTLKLYPIVVMGHLLGGLSILALLWLLHLKINPPRLTVNPATLPKAKQLKRISQIGLVILFFQLALGGWTSANYAALICFDFPTCQGDYWPTMDWAAAFNLSSVGVGIYDSPGTPLGNAAKVTIQMAHRLGALITTLMLTWLGFRLLKCHRIPKFRQLGLLMFCFLALQLCLGITNVLGMLPLTIAVLHNAVAALLFLTLITITFLVHYQPESKSL